jgi:protein-arginine kinase activator protein McsA
VPERQAAIIRREQELRGFHEQLRAAVASEAYEEAAAIRDRIREIEEGTA